MRIKSVTVSPEIVQPSLEPQAHPLNLDSGVDLSNKSSRGRFYFAKVLDAMKEAPHSVKAVIEKIDSVQRDLRDEIVSFTIAMYEYKVEALTLPTYCTSSNELTNALEALNLEPYLVLKQNQESALQKAFTFTKPDNCNITLETLGEARQKLSFFKRAKLEDATPFTWGYVLSCLEDLHPPHIQDTGKVLGKGGEAQVVEVAINAHRYALKKFSSKDTKPGELTESESEAKIALNLDHPYIMQPLMVDSSSILYEKAAGSMLSLVQGNIQLDSDELKGVLKKTALAMTYLHTKDILHRDLKIDNVLLCQDDSYEWFPRISDFSFACSTVDQEKLKKIQGTPSYFSKELAYAYLHNLLLSSAAYKKAEVYAFGMIIFELVCDKDYRSPIVDKASPKGAFEKKSIKAMLERRASFSKDLTKEHLEPLLDPLKRQTYDPDGTLFPLMCDCLQDNFERRPNMVDIVQRVS